MLLDAPQLVQTALSCSMLGVNLTTLFSWNTEVCLLSNFVMIENSRRGSISTSPQTVSQREVISCSLSRTWEGLKGPGGTVGERVCLQGREVGQGLWRC